MTVTARGSRRYKAIVAALKETSRLRQAPCARCGQRINYSAPPKAPDGFSAGHRKSWEDHPELREVPSNFQPEHLLCNQTAGKADVAPGIGTTSQEW